MKALALVLVATGLLVLSGCGSTPSVSGGSSATERQQTPHPLAIHTERRWERERIVAGPTTSPGDVDRFVEITYYPPLPPLITERSSSSGPTARGGNARLDGIGSAVAALPAGYMSGLWILLFGLGAIAALVLRQVKLGLMLAGVAALGLLPQTALVWCAAVVVTVGLGYLVYLAWQEHRRRTALAEVVRSVEAVKREVGSEDELNAVLKAEQSPDTRRQVRELRKGAPL